MSCTLPGCARDRYGNLPVCSMHYQRKRRTGSYDLAPRPTAQEAFWEKVSKDGPIPPKRPELGPCWEWTASTFHSGYGQFRHKGAPEGTSGYAHRAAWIWTHGPIGAGLHIDHLCENPLCVRASSDPDIPDHLEPVTRRDNILRGTGFAAVNARKTHCIHGHEYTPENTIWENGWRKCRTCRRAKDKARYEARKAARRQAAS